MEKLRIKRNAHYILAHDWEILKGERIPRWPSKIGEKRTLRAEITSWVGTYAIGARHFYARAEEQNNQWWCEDENGWVELSCDTEKSGLSLQADLMTEKEAIDVLLAFIEITGTRKTHRIVWTGPGRPKWGM
jgi:hypothetical protein